MPLLSISTVLALNPLFGSCGTRELPSQALLPGQMASCATSRAAHADSPAHSRLTKVLSFSSEEQALIYLASWALKSFKSYFACDFANRTATTVGATPSAYAPLSETFRASCLVCIKAGC